MVPDPSTAPHVHPQVSLRRLTNSLWALSGPGVRSWQEAQRVRVPGYNFSPAFKNGFWDGYRRPGTFKSRDGELHIGKGLAYKAARDFHPNIQLVDFLDPPNPIVQITPYPTEPYPLRDYQIEALELMRKRAWGKIAFATNAGKGAIIALYARMHLELFHRVLILADEIAVFDALAEELALWMPNVQVDQVAAGQSDIPQSRIVLAMVPTLSRRLGGGKATSKSQPWRDWVSRFEVVLADEADKATADRWLRILQHASGSHFRFGFSGSFPEKDDDPDRLLLEEHLGPTWLRVKNIELVKREISARPTMHLHRFETGKLFREPESWRYEKPAGATRRNEILEQLVYEDEERNAFIKSLINPDTPNVIIVRRLMHGEILSEFLDAPFLSGETTPNERRETLRQFMEGEIPIIIVTNILDRGTNKLGVSGNIIFASAEGSSRQTLQRLGRGLRRTDGKDEVTFHDIMDRSHKYLKDGARKRLALYQKEQFEIEIH